MSIKTLGNSLFFVAREASEAAKNDPALALRTSATVLTDTLLKGVDDSVRLGYQQSIVPVVRAGLLALDVHRCGQTLHDPTSTRMDKIMDVARVCTDLVGLAGGVAMLALPQYAKTGSAMMGFAYAADAVTHAYRGITHVDRRIKYWEAQLAKPSPTEPPAQAPNPGQKPKPVPTTLTMGGHTF